jgi:CHASE2 domain-containing sensor protein
VLLCLEGAADTLAFSICGFKNPSKLTMLLLIFVLISELCASSCSEELVSGGSWITEEACLVGACGSSVTLLRFKGGFN